VGIRVRDKDIVDKLIKQRQRVGGRQVPTGREQRFKAWAWQRSALILAAR
jgi:hypothetical protein